jgi:predicted DNA-binding protein (UPF0251 family)
MDNLVTVIDAARMLGINRRTIQRAVAKGAVKKHGELVNLAEVTRYTQSPTASGVRREESVSVQLRIEQFLNERGFDPREVMRLYLRARHGGADIDFLAFCIEQLRDQNEFFIALAMGVAVDDARLEKLLAYAAQRLVAFANEAGALPFPDLPFGRLWEGLAASCLEARIDVEPAIAYYEQKKTKKMKAELVLAPRWCRPPVAELSYRKDPETGKQEAAVVISETGAPSGALPLGGGYRSVIRTPRIEHEPEVNKALAKVEARIQETMGKGSTPLVEGVGAHGFLLASLADYQLLRLPPARARKEMATVLSLFDLTPEEMEVLIRAWRVFCGDTLSKATVLYDEGRGEFVERSAGERVETREEEGGDRRVDDGARRELFDSSGSTEAADGKPDSEGRETEADDELGEDADSDETGEDVETPDTSSGDTSTAPIGSTGDTGWSSVLAGHFIQPTELAGIFGVSRQTATRWIQAWMQKVRAVRHRRRSGA